METAKPFENVPGGSKKLLSGHFIPLVGFGTYKVVSEQVSPAIDAALGAGYRLFDTAKYYNNEAELGNAFQELLPKHGLSRSDIFLTTKIFPCDKDEDVQKLVEESLQHLKTSYIDLLLIHYPKMNDSDNNDPKNSVHRKLTYLALEKLQEAGKIKSLGVSNYEVSHMLELKVYAKVLPSVNQVEFHPHFVRRELHDYCNNNGVFLQAFSSLARLEPKLIQNPILQRIATERGVDATIILLAWAVFQGVGVIPKSSNVERIKNNFQVVDTHLSQEEVDELSKLDINQHYIRTTPWLVK